MCFYINKFVSIKFVSIFVSETNNKILIAMETLTINAINKANEIVKNANFTNIKNIRKNAGAMFLIVAMSDGVSIYGSYTSETYYINFNNKTFQLM